MLKIYSPNDTMPFGVNKGAMLSIVYKYLPDYLNWAIEETDLCINITLFEPLSCYPINYDVDFANYITDEFDNMVRQEKVRRKLNGIPLGNVYKEVGEIFNNRFQINNDRANSIEAVLQIIKFYNRNPILKNFTFSEKAVNENIRKIILINAT